MKPSLIVNSVVSFAYHTFLVINDQNAYHMCLVIKNAKQRKKNFEVLKNY